MTTPNDYRYRAQTARRWRRLSWWIAGLLGIVAILEYVRSYDIPIIGSPEIAIIEKDVLLMIISATGSIVATLAAISNAIIAWRADRRAVLAEARAREKHSGKVDREKQA